MCKATSHEAMKSIVTKIILIIVFTCFVLCASISAFDGNRKGFVMGAGTGFSPYIHLSVGSFKINKVGFPIIALIGFGIDERNVFALEGNLVIYSVSAGSDYGNPYWDHSVTQGFSGVTWYHFFKPDNNSLFLMGGVGFYRASETSGGSYFCYGNCPDYDPYVDFPRNWGIGYITGIGHELSKNLQIVLYISLGHPKDHWADFSHSAVHISTSVNWVKF